jgi:protease secretion system outer membrane protein
MKHNVLIFLCVFFTANADAGVLTLIDAYQSATTYDATLRSSKANNNAQQEEVTKAFSVFLPQVRLSLYQGKAFTNSETLSNGNAISNYSAYTSKNNSLSLRQSIYNKANFASYDQAKYLAAKSDLTLLAERSNLMTRVIGAYLDLILSWENLKYSDLQQKSFQAQFFQAQKRYAAGLGTITEMNEAQASVHLANVKIIEYKVGLESSKRALENITGIYPEFFYILDSSKLPVSLPDPPRIEDWTVLAKENNLEILAYQNEILAITQDVEKSRAAHYPTLDFVASKSHTQSDNNYTIGSTYDTDTLGLQLNLPIYSGGYASASVRQSVDKVEAANNQLDAKIHETSSKISKSFNEIVNGIEKIKALDLSVSSNEVALLGTQHAFEAGFRSNIEVLNAQDRLYSVKRDLVKERCQLIFNKVQLKYLIGKLSEDDVQKVSEWISLVQ